MRARRSTAALLAGAAMTLLVACGGGAGEPASTSSTGSAAPVPASTAAGSGAAAVDAARFSGSITVSAAASLTEAFTAIGEDFMTAYPETEVVFTFDSSATLAQQVIDGAPVDVYASADEANMAKLTEPGLVAGEPTVFGTNQLVIVTKPGNPQRLTGLADLSDVGVVSLCGAEVPCGTLAAQALETAGVDIPETTVTRGQNAQATLSAVSLGDAVAGVVYVSDASAAGDAVTAVEIPTEQNVVAVYPIGVIAAAANAAVAQAFVDYVISSDAQLALKDYGFGPPA